ncbi:MULTISPECIES: hypothetical protein [Paenibacillus]|uniref:hypothetical protein n=1 Tax=Paenibacillus TaxID=44249 RepID=UPI000F51DAA0|nr:hypothetical protein [Paenibacillus xylanexedens]
MKGNLPDSSLVGNMISLPTPDGNSVFYPAKLAMMAMNGQYVLFHTISDSGNAYLCTTQPDCVRIRAIGGLLDIATAYESRPWDEETLRDQNGIFFYKIAPSLDELNKFGDSLSSN